MRREENYQEFLRLKQDADYLDVTYDEKSGGMSAVHRGHKFSKKDGAFGGRQGDYELSVLEVLRGCGHRVVLGEETNTPGVKSCDGFLDDFPLEIKAIEGQGIWAVSTKLLYAEKQHAQCVALYFPEEELYSEKRVSDGIGKYMANPMAPKEMKINKILAISRNKLLSVWDKKATPIEGWSIPEGFRRENGANSYTLSPSDAKI